MRDKTFWMRPLDTKLGQWQQQIKEVTKSSSFCIIPWIHIATRPNGDARVCCVANASGADTGEYTVGIVKKEDGNHTNFANDLPSDAFNNEHMKSIRKIMLEGNVPKNCTKCFEEEAEGIVSKRVWETGAWYLDGSDIPTLIESTNKDGSIPFKVPYWDLRLGHTCNLKCVSCSPHDSSLWVNDYKKIIPILSSKQVKDQMTWDVDTFNNQWYENPNFWDEIYSQIPNIKHLYFAGGEPLLIKEHNKFLLEIIKRGYADKIHLRYNTNGTLINSDMIDIWSKFKVVKVNFSLDGLGDKNYYIRYPAKWSDIENSLQLLDNSPNNIHVNFAFTVQLLNIKHLPEFIKWKLNSKFKKINNQINASGHMQAGGLVGTHLLWLPTHLSIRALPKKDKEEVQHLFSELKTWLYENYNKDIDFWEINPWGWQKIQGLLDWMEAKDTSHLIPDFKDYINSLDKIRGTDAKEIFPELEHLL